MRKWINIISLTEGFGHVIDFNPNGGDETLFRLDLKAHSGTLTTADIKSFARFLNDNKMNYIRMYHGTSDKHDVMGKGLLPTSASRARSIQTTSGFVYLAYDPQSAVNFARMAYAGDYTAMITVYAADILVRRLLPDHDQLYNKRMWGNNPDIGATLADSLIYGRGARVRGKIDPMQLHIFGRFDKHGNPITDDAGLSRKPD